MTATRDGTRCADLYRRLREGLSRVIVGQEEVVEQTICALLSEGHVLIIGVPGLAKTLLISTLARLLGLSFRRIQFTPDLMPSDITGTSIVAEDPERRTREFRFVEGPIFANIVLADEINRTPPKTQAALMEAMEERQVTYAGRRLPLPRPFFVLATQNPIEQEGTYPLPVSQLDRFFFSIMIDYPHFDEEYAIMYRTTSAYHASVEPVVSAEELPEVLAEVRSVELSPQLTDWIERLVRNTRPKEAQAPPLVKEYVRWGAGPRACQVLLLAARARAAMHGRRHVEREDVSKLFLPALRHRLILTYHAQAEGITADSILKAVLLEGPSG